MIKSLFNFKKNFILALATSALVAIVLLLSAVIVSPLFYFSERTFEGIDYTDEIEIWNSKYLTAAEYYNSDPSVFYPLKTIKDANTISKIITFVKAHKSRWFNSYEREHSIPTEIGLAFYSKRKLIQNLNIGKTYLTTNGRKYVKEIDKDEITYILQLVDVPKGNN